MNAIEKLRLMALSTCEKGNSCINCQTEELFDIADRIEAEYMELPRDKNDEVIHVGDFLSEGEGSIAEVMTIGHDGFTDLSGGFNHVYSWELVKPEQPDSMEQIKADAVKSDWGYWECTGYACDFCSAKRASLDGKTPMAKYGEDNCEYCMHLDLVARTEKLLGGEQE